MNNHSLERVFRHPYELPVNTIGLAVAFSLSTHFQSNAFLIKNAPMIVFISFATLCALQYILYKIRNAIRNMENPATLTITNEMILSIMKDISENKQKAITEIENLLAAIEREKLQSVISTWYTVFLFMEELVTAIVHSISGFLTYYIVRIYLITSGEITELSEYLFMFKLLTIVIQIYFFVIFFVFAKVKYVNKAK